MICAGDIMYYYDWTVHYKEMAVIVLEQPAVTGRANVSVYVILSGKVMDLWPEELYRTKSGGVI